MLSSTIIAALGALPMAFAYYPAGNATASYAAAPSGTGTASPSVQTVTVGQNGLTFTPDTIRANVGDAITFQFFPKNHSVVQADFNNPCNPKEGGIFSGFSFPTSAGPANQTFTITVQDDKPVWLYCSALQPKPHCAAGMVAVINPPAQGPNTLDAFRNQAAKTNTSTSPLTGPSGGEVENASPGSASPSSSSPNSTVPSPGSPSNSAPSGTASGTAAESTGAASSLVVSSGAVGAMVALFAGLLL